MLALHHIDGFDLAGEALASLPIETITRLKEEQFQNEKTFHKIKGKTIQMQETTDFTDNADKK